MGKNTGKMRMCVRLKSGREFYFSCDKYSMTRSNITGELEETSFEGMVGECPIYLRPNEIESVSRIIEEDDGGEEEPEPDCRGCMAPAVNYRDCDECHTLKETK